jgi:ribosomal protein S18 acetylase RimI-like enzyme
LIHDTSKDYFLRPVHTDDQPSLQEFLKEEECILHQHLDWHSALEWLGSQPFWILGKAGKIIAALACPYEPSGMVWVRLFAASPQLRSFQTWNLLFQKILEVFADNPPTLIASLALKRDYTEILLQSGFQPYQFIVVLEKVGKPPQFSKPSGVNLRLMQIEDLETITALDRAAFEPLWHNSQNILTHAYQQSNYATVVEKDGCIVAYQISTNTIFNAHLARIAVQPDLQQTGIASILISDLISFFYLNGISRITVNTQSNNQASLALYQKTGFRKTGEKFSVFHYHFK